MDDTAIDHLTVAQAVDLPTAVATWCDDDHPVRHGAGPRLAVPLPARLGRQLGQLVAEGLAAGGGRCG